MVDLSKGVDLANTVLVKREHLEFFKTVYASAYGYLHYKDVSDAAANLEQVRPRPLTNLVEVAGQAALDYLEGNEVVLPHERVPEGG